MFIIVKIPLLIIFTHFTCMKAAVYLYIDKEVTYNQGRQVCQKYGLDLAKVNSEEQVEDLNSIYRTESTKPFVMIGVHYWINIEFKPQFLRWVDYSIVNVELTRWYKLKWVYNEPDNLLTDHCVVVRRDNFKWHTRPCTERYPVMCGPYAGNHAQDAGYLYIDKERTYENGRKLCQRHGLDLAKVNSEKELVHMNSIYRTLSKKPFVMIGIRYRIPYNMHVDYIPEYYRWDDYSKVNMKVARWNTEGESNEPKDLNTNHCVVVRRDNSLWHTGSCADKYPVMCGPFPNEEQEPVSLRFSSFQKYKDDFDFVSEPAMIIPGSSLVRCSEACYSSDDNCKLFSIRGRECRVYGDRTTQKMQPKKDNHILIMTYNSITSDQEYNYPDY